MNERVRFAIDYAVRLAFFAFVPSLLVYAAAYFPIMGALFNVAFALVIFTVAESVRGAAEKRPWLRKLFGRQLKLEAYYREHPVRRFLYYVFYPFFFPYWLWNRDARAEFLLFKGYTIVSLLLLVASLVYQYFRYWRPELHFGTFLEVTSLVILVETLITLAFLVPLATTVIGYTLRKKSLALYSLLAVGAASAAWEVVKLEHLRDPIVSDLTRVRVGLRTRAAPDRAETAQRDALHAAWSVLDQASTTEGEGDGKIQGEALKTAQDTLREFYKRDEVKGFDLWATPRHHPKLLVIYAERSIDEGHSIWLALLANGEVSRDKKDLPPKALGDMREAAGR
jgi:hypothetical protein